MEELKRENERMTGERELKKDKKRRRKGKNEAKERVAGIIQSLLSRTWAVTKVRPSAGPIAVRADMARCDWTVFKDYGARQPIRERSDEITGDRQETSMSRAY